MAIELKIPGVGESITEVQIGEWLKAEGDPVKKDEGVAVIESEKTTFELPAPEGGKLVKILHQTGETVGVGTVIAYIEPNGANPGVVRKQTTDPETKHSAEKDTKPDPSATAPKQEDTSMSAKENVPARAESESTESKELDSRPGAGKAAKQQETADQSSRDLEPPPPLLHPGENSNDSTHLAEEIVPMTMLRRTVARRLAEARQQMSMLTTFNEVDMTAVQTLRKEHQENFEGRYHVKLGLMSFFVKAVIDALKQIPGLNAEIRGNDIIYHNYFDIGVAISTERGLVVPVLRNADRLSFAELERTISDFARRANDVKLKPNELEGGSFTITNGGVFGSLLSTPIINPPQTGILGMHFIQERPIAVKGQVVVRPMMYIALTYDHRLVDGREAVLFLRRVKEAVETPARMLIEA